MTLDLPRARRCLQAATADIASVSLCVRTPDGAGSFTAGLARREPPRVATPDQRYDLASLTKALVGSSVAAALAADGVLDVNAPVAEVLPGLDPRITASHLLGHSAGFPAWRPLYKAVTTPQTAGARRTILDLARAEPVDRAPGEDHVYSDLGFLVLCDLVETLGGSRLDSLFQRHVLDVLGLKGPRFDGAGAAATERCPWRGRVVEGEVHDLNAWAMGGVSAHAGLFGSASEVAALGAALAFGENRICRTLQGWWERPGVGTHRGGWDRPTRGGYTSTGQHFPDGTVGHLGYTGCSMWAVPARETVVVLLTNRVHEVDDLAAIRALRPALHDAVAQDLGWAAGS
jgi:CubicO group peptidase (beta-lactamase class C family)